MLCIILHTYFIVAGHGVKANIFTEEGTESFGAQVFRGILKIFWFVWTSCSLMKRVKMSFDTMTDGPKGVKCHLTLWRMVWRESNVIWYCDGCSKCHLTLWRMVRSDIVTDIWSERSQMSFDIVRDGLKGVKCHLTLWRMVWRETNVIWHCDRWSEGSQMSFDIVTGGSESKCHLTLRGWVFQQQLLVKISR